MKRREGRHSIAARAWALALVLLAGLLVVLAGASCGSPSGSPSSGETSEALTAGHSTNASEGTAADTSESLSPSPAASASVRGTTGTPSATASASPNGHTSPASETKETGACLWGTVLGSNGKPVAGAKIRVVLNAADSRYSPDGTNLVGSAIADADGHYRVEARGLPRGSVVDVVVTRAGYMSVFVYGTCDRAKLEVDFIDFGSDGGDRRMPVGDQTPPLPFEGLLPGSSGT